MTWQPKATILIVDDEISVRDSLTQWFRRDGYNVEAAENATDALKALQTHTFDLVLLDIRMPGMDGLELQRRIKETDPSISVIMITAFASVETAVEALKQGAYDYITKPVDPDELSHLVRNALEQRRLKSENVRLREHIEEVNQPEEVVGESAAMKKVLEMVRSVSQTDATVLIRGESGTGKEVIARLIHANSPRRYFQIVPVNCGAFTETLLESELFGHEKGAFTGAQYRRKGKIELADGGTLFLDEVGTISQKTQVDLLRVLETKEFTRVGGTKPVRVDFRVIGATNQNLEKMVEEGTFREDLYYRLNVFSLLLPPLRERREDIPLFANHFLKKYSRQMDKKIEEISPEAMDSLVRYRWPGNVRELANAMERAVVVGKPPAIRQEDLPFQVEHPANGSTGDSLEDMERVHVQRMLERMEWNITQAAETLGIDRVTLYNKIKKYDLRK
ncbi:MAG TPA: sigma-54 dependent transcriptional regulator [Bdellovibrionota bacterium]|nr:sigma-54 dependent transcriptional regulator [Bdellovibrionota bacterium]